MLEYLLLEQQRTSIMVNLYKKLGLFYVGQDIDKTSKEQKDIICVGVV